jgi:flagellar protein FlaG
MKIEGVVASTGNVAPQIIANESAGRVDREKVGQAQQQAQNAQPNQKTSDEHEVGSKLLSNAVSQVDKMLQSFDDTLHISVHEETKRVMVRIVNNSTGEVIREFPPKKFLDMVASFQKQLAGLFVDERK